MARIELEGVSKVYGGTVRAVNSLSLDIADGDFMVFVGPSGCGKTTALRMVADLEDITPKTQARPGRMIDLAIDTSTLHFFDPTTGHAIAYRHTTGNGARATTGA
jgi:ABC-type nitrate/sulfonate/bicarbonate transport system ATPase subunit